MKSKAERQADFRRREDVRKAKYAAAKDRHRARGEALQDRSSRQRDQRRATPSAPTAPPFPAPPSLFETLTFRGWIRYTREARLYAAAYQKQQQRIAAGEDVPVEQRLRPLPTFYGG